MRFNRLNSWLDWLESLQIKRNAYLARQQVAEVAKKLKLLPLKTKVVTVAGTNGKGSCVALLESIYTTANYKVGAFTSPHLLSFNERIRLQQQPVDDTKIIAAFDLIDRNRGDIQLNYFQFSFLAALLIFQAANLDLIILEVGIGGQYDATNIVDTDAAIISSIDLDHCEILGDTRELIGKDKAGIMRYDKPAICGDFNPPATVFTVAKKIGAKLYCRGKEFSFTVTKDAWNWYCNEKQLLNLPIPPNILLQNAATVLMTVEKLSSIIPISKIAISRGLSKVSIAGRQQLVNTHGIQLLLDVTHNPAAAKELAARLQTMRISGKKYAIVGMLQHKDILNTLACFIDEIDQWFIVELASMRSAKTTQICAALQQQDVKNIQCYANTSLALQEALQRAEVDDIIVTFGSFLLVADVLQVVRGSGD
jgi:dihydrofolate synthase/folylpolyglutamate synthase